MLTSFVTGSKRMLRRRAGLAGLGFVAALGCAALAVSAAAPEQRPAAPVPPAPRPSPAPPGWKTLPQRSAEEWRKLYPIESLADRLAYEKDARDRSATVLDADTRRRLDETEKRWGGYPFLGVRTESLKKLHSAEVEDFIKREDFGMARMPVPSPRYLDLPAAPSIPFPAITLGPDGPGPKVELPQKTAAAGAAGGAMPLPSLEQLAGLHFGGQFQFFSPPSFGYVKDREHVAGFRSHEFRAMPAFLPKPVSNVAERWKIRRLELVSLLKHEEPGVYVLDQLPRMEALKGAKVRPLSEFEADALAKLRKGEDLVTDAAEREVRMVGSLRATKQCLQCHDVKRGDLLGCFSYDLVRVDGAKAGR